MPDRPTRPQPPADPVTLRLTLPLPPGVNNQYVTVGRRRVLSKTARAFHHDAKAAIELARRDGTVTPTIERALAASTLGVMLEFYFETPNRRDLDGGLKITLDVLGEALGFDDRTVVDLHLSKRIDPLRPRVEIEIETIADWEYDQTFVYLGPGDTTDPATDDDSPD
ncbi:MAG TPA: RusA family crossover junction endodeoxyribonuclease [Thermomicrobiales bacterium]|nr:RusA family crossover junction endodeoxyribonuclease [Thermomicrobiales bacterium]